MQPAMKRKWLTLWALIVLPWSFTGCGKKTADTLTEGFLHPPDSARPGVYWYFMDGNLSREAITGDLESMRAAGIGAVIFLEVNVGVPRGKVDFLGEEWQSIYTHAVRECERLGLELILGSGPGWAGSGGPWVTPAQSMQHLVGSLTHAQGPAFFDAHLPTPAPKAPYFGERTLTPQLKELRDGWYEDVAVLAYPTPATSTPIESIDEKALYYRAPYTSKPGVRAYLPAPAHYPETAGAAIDQARMVDLTDRLQPDGRLRWEVPEGAWTILRLGKRNNGAVTRPAPKPGLGFECDKMDAAAFDAHFDAYIGKLLEVAQPQNTHGRGGWTMLHIDSWEMGAQNWTRDFRQQFLKRRGYDPRPYLPAYTGQPVNSLEQSERFLWDMRLTAQELVIENHARRLKHLGRRYGFTLSIEPYDMNPTADLDLGSVADIPMCEFWTDGFGFNSAFSCIEATSIAHVLGRPIVAAEAFTAAHEEAWKKYPGNIKNQNDWAFAMGINRLMYHTFAHKPYGDRLRPGVVMGPYGVHWDRGQTWWPMAEAYHRYVARCQFVLSHGNAVADILYLTPEGAPHVFRPPPSAMEGTPVMPDKRAYAFDGCSPRMLMEHADVRDGRICFPGGGSYRVLVLPLFETMTPELLAKIESLVADGALVTGSPPLKSPSLVNHPACDRQVQTQAAHLWGTNAAPTTVEERPHGKGRIVWGGALAERDADSLYPSYASVAALLVRAGVQPDFTSDGSIRYLHRSLPDREIYFISNRTDQTIEPVCTFRDGRLAAERWDAVNGQIDPLRGLTRGPAGVSARIKLAAFQSAILVFDTRKNARTVAPSPAPAAKESVAQTLEGPWRVSFDPAWGGPADIVFDSLVDWTARPEDGIRHYSGIATYSKTFDLPDTVSASTKTPLYLDLGAIRHMARVRLNGHDLGVIWTAPWRVPINATLLAKNNRLEIEVANLWINRLIGDEYLPDDGVQKGAWPDWVINGTPRPSGRYTFTTHRFHKKDHPLEPSGLLGPVTVVQTR